MAVWRAFRAGDRASAGAVQERVTPLNRGTVGERGIPGKSLDEAATIRSAEAQAACKILNAEPLFFGQIDGATEVNRAQVDAMVRLLADHRPDVIFTHWPVDTHPDHQVASVLAIRAWMGLPASQLYFFEVNTGSQTEGFLPNTYVDISAGVELGKGARVAHKRQDGEGSWKEHHAIMAQGRGRGAGGNAAAAFGPPERGARLRPLPVV